jgi:acetyl-CoA/propionyl-CoA carboxylase biotin carboxyl carrier protein
MDREELSPSEAARRIGTTTRTVQRWIARGALPARRVGGRWRVASDALDAFSREGRKDDDAARPATHAAWLERAGVRALFVANRGEIAARIRRTGVALGLRVVVPAASGPAELDLLDIEAVVGAAVDAGADALHPGFGFLAENADFAAAVEAAGIRWVGPPPTAIRAMGDKAAARRLAVRLRVPVVPGYDESDQSEAALSAAARRIRMPLLVKPAAGGGGKGIRVVRTEEGLRDAIGAARREALAAFGDDRLILERLVEGARHVEIQVLFDAAGDGVHLGERDCSIQRRNQKILEETPSPAVDGAMRARLGRYALQLAGAVGYASAGTCEFLLDDGGAVAFLEMNTRLQVEHPVTELVTGRDLVADQLAIAAGASLSDLGLDQASIDAARAAGGHAIEVRLYAEDADDGFLPATGRVEALRWPAGPGIRVDAGVELGDVVGGRFDPMLAKVITHAADRAGALDRLGGALDRAQVLGLTTNLRFLGWLVRQPVVRDGDARIDTLARIWPPDGWASTTMPPEAAWEVAALALSGAGPWSDGWRPNGPAVVRLATDTEGRTIRLGRSPADASVGVDATAEHATSPAEPAWVRVGDIVHVDVAGRSVPFRLAPPPDVDRAARAAAHHHGGGPVELSAPMPGAVLAVHVARDADVEAGDPIVTLEAMKMEHVVVAPIAGTVTDLAVRPAEQVARAQLLAILEP